ncbi:hypothetical protein ABTN05_20260, partial [Acinetobacter baumannii]
VRQIDKALLNPVWDQVRLPAPWDGVEMIPADTAPELALGVAMDSVIPRAEGEVVLTDAAADIAA